MLNMDEVNLTKSEWNHGEKIFEGGGGTELCSRRGTAFCPEK